MECRVSVAASETAEAAAAKNVVFSANEPARAAGNLYRAAATTINNVLVLGANAK